MGVYDTLINIGDNVVGVHNILMDVRDNYMGIY